MGHLLPAGRAEAHATGSGAAGGASSFPRSIPAGALAKACATTTPTFLGKIHYNTSFSGFVVHLPEWFAAILQTPNYELMFNIGPS
jgi:hypothetical protein